MTTHKKALVFGATGLVGSKLLKFLEEDEHYKELVVVNRTLQHYRGIKVKEHELDFSRLEDFSELFSVDEVFCCLGTTIKKARSKEAFKEVDLELVRQIAELAKAGAVKTLIHISSLGADPNSSNFYLRVKGKAEAAVKSVGLQWTYAMRPSMLLGKRNEKRFGEAIGKYLIEKLSFLLIGKLKKYRGVYDWEVAKAMLIVANSKPKTTEIESIRIKELATK